MLTRATFMELLDIANVSLSHIAGGLAVSIDMATGDRLVLYTDGLVEVFNQSHEMLAVKGLEKLVRESAMQPLPRMKQTILDGVAAWRRGLIADDISLMIIELQ